MPLTLEEIEERLIALEEGLKRRLRSSKAFTSNPLALATDLGDLGSVKTHLDFEEAPLIPVNPPADVGRLYTEARSGVGADSVMRYIGTGGAKSELTHPPLRVCTSNNDTVDQQHYLDGSPAYRH